MDYPPPFRAKRLIWRFRRKGHESRRTRSFDGFPRVIRESLSRAADIGCSETPALASVLDRDNWVLLTTARLVWSTGGAFYSIPCPSVEQVDAPRQDGPEIHFRGSTIPDHCRLRIITSEGSAYEIALESGLPFVGFLDVLFSLVRANRERRSG